MKLNRTLAALALALLAGSAFAGTTPAAGSTPAAAPAASTKPAHKAKATLHCKAGETAVKGKCEKKPK
jgi:hypothetical protein